MSELNNLIKKKKEIEEQIREKILEEKQNKKNNCNSKSSVQIRVSKEFNDDLDFVIRERVKLKKDKKEIPKQKLTGLIRKHNSWRTILNESITYEFEE